MSVLCIGRKRNSVNVPGHSFLQVVDGSVLRLDSVVPQEVNFHTWHWRTADGLVLDSAQPATRETVSAVSDALAGTIPNRDRL